MSYIHFSCTDLCNIYSALSRFWCDTVFYFWCCPYPTSDFPLSHFWFSFNLARVSYLIQLPNSPYLTSDLLLYPTANLYFIPLFIFPYPILIFNFILFKYKKTLKNFFFLKTISLVTWRLWSIQKCLIFYWKAYPILLSHSK